MTVFEEKEKGNFINSMDKFENITDLCEVIMSKINQTDEDMDWESVLNILRLYSTKFGGFNIFPEKISDIDDWKNLYDEIQGAYNNKNPLIKRNCKTCGEPFFIYKSEVDFFKDNNLPLPKRCKGCRKKRKLENGLETDIKTSVS